MCPLTQIVPLAIIILLIKSLIAINSLEIHFDPNNSTIHMQENILVKYSINGLISENYGDLTLYTENPNIAIVEKDYVIESSIFPINGSFNLTGNFLGETKVLCKIIETNELLEGSMDVIVIRKKRVIDDIFTSSVATLVSIIYINFGCALNWRELKRNVLRPVGPLIGLSGQFILMPILSFFLAKLLFPDNYEMQLGMFFTGVSPAGGASNVWTVILNGNMDLSITMTAISTFAAFGMIPLWIFTLGRLIFEDANWSVPYFQISTYAIGLVVPLAIGCLIAKYFTKIARFLVKILKGFSSLLILFIIIFAIVTNLYLFQLFSWQIVVAGMGLPYLGYLLAYIVAKLLKQPQPDCLAIAIETGIQNTGIAIFLLRFSLPQPQADLTTVVPVSVAIMTPFPLILIFFYNKIKARWLNSHKKILVNYDTPDIPSGSTITTNNGNKTEDQLITTIS